MIKILLLIFLFCGISSIAQNIITEDSDYLIENQDSSDLLEYLNTKNQERITRIINYTYSNLSGSGNVIFTDESIDENLYDIENGNPIYYTAFNENAASTISTSSLYAGGGLGLDLDGTNAPNIAIWDELMVRTTHQEFEGRVIQIDGATGFGTGHATHVAGTMVAAGVNIDAKGMAPNANLFAYSWVDDEKEIIEAVDDFDIRFSNHSYGQGRGWVYRGRTWEWEGDTSISSVEDYQFGRYNEQANVFDEIAFNNNRLLMVVAAGNDRNDVNPFDRTDRPDGDYDCIADKSVSKNTLTVGAVSDITTGYSGSSSVRMSTFSSWGPVDDGRIKPDIVANGVNLESSEPDSDSDYGFQSGTSMSTPSVTGSLALLNELVTDLESDYIDQASTYKGLVIHTADEAGNADGPDYEFGWGLMNTLRAAEVLMYNENGCDVNGGSTVINNDDVLRRNVYESFVTNTGSLSYIICYVNKLENFPLKVTISWTDPADEVHAKALNDRTPSLVNDVDIRVISPSNRVFQPWTLDPDNPTAPAVRSDNEVDNIEQIYIDEAEESGLYTIVINGQAMESLVQRYSLIVTGNDRLEQNFTINESSSDHFSRTIENGETEFLKARNFIEISDEYIVENGAEASLFSESITVKSGFHAENGSDLLLTSNIDCDLPESFVFNQLSSKQFNYEYEEEINEVGTFENETNNLNENLELVVSLYPNPIDNLLNISLENTSEEDISEVTIFSESGKIIYNKNKNENNNIELKSIDLAGYSSGLYVLQLSLKNGTKLNKKFIKK